MKITPIQYLSWLLLGTMQIYASYDFRHDFVHRMKPGERIINAEDHPKSQADLEAVHGYNFSNVPRQPPVMQKALAWELILRNIHKLEVLALPLGN